MFAGKKNVPTLCGYKKKHKNKKKIRFQKYFLQSPFLYACTIFEISRRLDNTSLQINTLVYKEIFQKNPGNL